MKVISVEGVSKKFILAHDRPRNLADAARGMFRRKQREDFWALKDVSFEVEQGEALGIIGHNGAGKSTMLKLLTRIMDPTKGHIRTRGRVSALIEVGAGFHPEMTGRENVYLNGSIIGMSQREIAAKFDEIVAFAELEKFIDTPVKRYSSGMYARLGFAVAAHVDPEILIVDEVLSVGDSGFQQKCIERMRSVKRGGTTIVFVSHNLNAVTLLCTRALGLWRGKVFSDAVPAEVAAQYRNLMSEGILQDAVTAERPTADIIPDVVVTKLESLTPSGEWQVFLGDPWTVRLHYLARRRVAEPSFSLRFVSSDGTVLAHPSTTEYEQSRDVEGSGFVDFRADYVPMVPGRYTLEARIWDATGVMQYDLGLCHAELVVAERPVKDSAGVRATNTSLIRLAGNWVWPD